MNRLRQLLTIPLIILVLAGTQVVQASPLHEHLNHVAGCALCHYDSNQNGLPVTAQHVAATRFSQVYGIQSSRTYAAVLILPYQGRAPPASSR